MLKAGLHNMVKPTREETSYPAAIAQPIIATRKPPNYVKVPGSRGEQRQRKKKKKRDHTPNDEQKWPRKHKALDVQRCFFCEKGRKEAVLHEVSTFDADKNIWHDYRAQ